MHEAVEDTLARCPSGTKTAETLPAEKAREHLAQSIRASLAIENNCLSLEEVTALLEGKNILAPRP